MLAKFACIKYSTVSNSAVDPDVYIYKCIVRINYCHQNYAVEALIIVIQRSRIRYGLDRDVFAVYGTDTVWELPSSFITCSDFPPFFFRIRGLK